MNNIRIMGGEKIKWTDITHYGKGAYYKDERSLGGRGGRPNVVTINNSDVIVLSNNDVILRSEGGRGSKKA